MNILYNTSQKASFALFLVKHAVELANACLSKKNWHAIFYFLVFFIMPVAVLAECRANQLGNGMDDYSVTMCYIVCVLYSGVGRAIAVMGVIVLGLGATFGKVSWGLALTVVIGVTAVFGAPSIINATVGYANFSCKDTWGVQIH